MKGRPRPFDSSESHLEQHPMRMKYLRTRISGGCLGRSSAMSAVRPLELQSREQLGNLKPQ